MDVAKNLLAKINSAMYYLADRGEFDDDMHPEAISPQVRYTKIKEIDHMDVVTNGKVVRIKAEIIGDHYHVFDDYDSCSCGAYNEDE